MDAKTLQYIPFTSSIDTSFWSSFTKMKINELKLSTDPISVKGSFSKFSKEGIPALFRLSFDAFSSTSENTKDINLEGILINTNTKEGFLKDLKEKDTLNKGLGNQLWKTLKDGTAIQNPQLLNTFFMYVFGDLKKYKFSYWLAFPAFPQFLAKTHCESKYLSESFSENQIDQFHTKYNESTGICLNYFVLEEGSDDLILHKLSSYHDLKSDGRRVFLVFSDPSNSPSHPGWPLRNLLTLMKIQWPDIEYHSVIGLRESSGQRTSFGKSVVWSKVSVTQKETIEEEYPNCTGWERNSKGNLTFKMADVRSLMDPSQIAESAIDLNLSLMKWRLAPTLDLDGIKNTRCLLLGAGTLGCNVARCLLGWSIRKITFVDSGTVSYSNPVRQSLFKFEDSTTEGNFKALVAAKALREIRPTVESCGVVLTIPMPGHIAVSDEEIEEARKNFSHLESLIKDHDVIFLLTDSRESRWLPTLLGLVHGKLVITSALGFDSYLVMRHGTKMEGSQENTLGCYFCSDVVSPMNTTADRTLDQQCTVTRPGMSMMAAGQAVELMVSTLQHPNKVSAGASGSDDFNETALGAVPHCLRYYASRLQYMPTVVSYFKNCSACSSYVVDAFEKDGFDFLIKVFNEPSYLEEICQLSKLKDFNYDDCLSLGSDEDEIESI